MNHEGKARIWHYTTADALEGIFGDGEIKCDRIYLEGEIRCVWLSTNASWEETVRKAVRNMKTGEQSAPLSRDALFNAGFSPVRIEINTRSVKITDWKTHCKKIPKKVAQGLECAAKSWGGNPEDWRVSYKPIPVKSFVSPIEAWDGKRWIEAFKRERKAMGNIMNHEERIRELEEKERAWMLNRSIHLSLCYVNAF